MVFSNENKILIKSLYLKRYTTKRLTEEFSEKSWTKHDVKLLKNLRNTGRVDIATKRNPTTTGSSQSHKHFIKENNYAFECLIFANTSLSSCKRRSFFCCRSVSWTLYSTLKKRTLFSTSLLSAARCRSPARSRSSQRLPSRTYYRRSAVYLLLMSLYASVRTRITNHPEFFQTVWNSLTLSGKQYIVRIK